MVSTMDDVRWLTEQEERAWRGLQFMQMHLEHELAQQLAVESGLSYPDYHVLVTLPLLVLSVPFHHLFPLGIATAALSFFIWEHVVSLKDFKPSTQPTHFSVPFGS